MTKIKRPLLRYFGGKFQLRNWIASHMPPHQFYAEPFAGAASVLLGKSPAPGGEIINDLNADVVNLFQVMQNADQADELQRRLDWTPYAHAELIVSRESSDDPVEKARRMVVRSFMGIEVSGTKGSTFGFRMNNVDLRRLDQSGKRTFRNCAVDWNNWKQHLPLIRKRIADVMIYSMDALKFIDIMDSPDCLLYVDPPYHHDTRGSTRYTVEFADTRHHELVERLLECRASVVLSGYQCDAYAPLEAAGWTRVDKDYRANMSLTRRTESLWISPPDDGTI